MSRNDMEFSFSVSEVVNLTLVDSLNGLQFSIQKFKNFEARFFHDNEEKHCQV